MGRLFISSHLNTYQFPLKSVGCNFLPTIKAEPRWEEKIAHSTNDSLSQLKWVARFSSAYYLY